MSMLPVGLLLAATAIVLFGAVVGASVADRRAVYRSLRTMRAAELSPTE